ncbi:unnamed protein product [Closterium sp. NIES-54]
MGPNGEPSSKLSERKKDALAQAGRRKLEEFRQRKRAAVACTGTGANDMQQEHGTRDRVCRQATVSRRVAGDRNANKKVMGLAEQSCDRCWIAGDVPTQESIVLSRSCSATSASCSSFDPEGSSDEAFPGKGTAVSTSAADSSEGEAGYVRIAGTASFSVKKNGSMLVWLQALVECWPYCGAQVAREPLAEQMAAAAAGASASSRSASSTTAKPAAKPISAVNPPLSQQPVPSRTTAAAPPAIGPPAFQSQPHSFAPTALTRPLAQPGLAQAPAALPTFRSANFGSPLTPFWQQSQPSISAANGLPHPPGAPGSDAANAAAPPVPSAGFPAGSVASRPAGAMQPLPFAAKGPLVTFAKPSGVTGPGPGGAPPASAFFSGSRGPAQPSLARTFSPPREPSFPAQPASRSGLAPAQRVAPPLARTFSPPAEASQAQKSAGAPPPAFLGAPSHALSATAAGAPDAAKPSLLRPAPDAQPSRASPPPPAFSAPPPVKVGGGADGARPRPDWMGGGSSQGRGMGPLWGLQGNTTGNISSSGTSSSSSGSSRGSSTSNSSGSRSSGNSNDTVPFSSFAAPPGVSASSSTPHSAAALAAGIGAGSSTDKRDGGADRDAELQSSGGRKDKEEAEAITRVSTAREEAAGPGSASEHGTSARDSKGQGGEAEPFMGGVGESLQTRVGGVGGGREREEDADAESFFDSLSPAVSNQSHQSPVMIAAASRAAADEVAVLPASASSDSDADASAGAPADASAGASADVPAAAASETVSASTAHTPSLGPTIPAIRNSLQEQDLLAYEVLSPADSESRLQQGRPAEDSKEAENEAHNRPAEDSPPEASIGKLHGSVGTTGGAANAAESSDPSTPSASSASTSHDSFQGASASALPLTAPPSASSLPPPPVLPTFFNPSAPSAAVPRPVAKPARASFLPSAYTSPLPSSSAASPSPSVFIPSRAPHLSAPAPAIADVNSPVASLVTSVPAPTSQSPAAPSQEDTDDSDACSSPHFSSIPAAHGSESLRFAASRGADTGQASAPPDNPPSASESASVHSQKEDTHEHSRGNGDAFVGSEPVSPKALPQEESSVAEKLKSPERPKGSAFARLFSAALSPARGMMRGDGGRGRGSGIDARVSEGEEQGGLGGSLEGLREEVDNQGAALGSVDEGGDGGVAGAADGVGVSSQEAVRQGQVRTGSEASWHELEQEGREPAKGGDLRGQEAGEEAQERAGAAESAREAEKGEEGEVGGGGADGEESDEVVGRKSEVQKGADGGRDGSSRRRPKSISSWWNIIAPAPRSEERTGGTKGAETGNREEHKEGQDGEEEEEDWGGGLLTGKGNLGGQGLGGGKSLSASDLVNVGQAVKGAGDMKMGVDDMAAGRWQSWGDRGQAQGVHGGQAKGLQGREWEEREEKQVKDGEQRRKRRGASRNQKEGFQDHRGCEG